MKRTRWWAVAAGVVVLALVGAAVPNGVGAGTAEAAVTGGGSAKRTVTLITGDRVTIERGGDVAVVPGPGRKGTTFITDEVGGRLRVVPSDAVRLLRGHRLDPALFEVTQLLDAGYGSSRPLPLIVKYGSRAARGTVRSQLVDGGAARVRELSVVRAYAAHVPAAAARQIWDGLTKGSANRTLAGGVAKVWLDGQVRASLDVSVPQIGAPEAWRSGYTGKGVKVAVLDTGIDVSHPDLADAVVASADFSGSESGTDDRMGHGTHVASTITGDGTASDGRYRGVAPDAELLNGKVLSDFGFGEESTVVAGMQWAVDQGADVVNLSLGGPDTPETDIVEEAVNELTARHGVLFVIAAGNSGPVASTVTSPGSADAALTVGAVDDKDVIADFSSRGPRLGDAGLKPELTAPGVDIVAARAAATRETDDEYYWSLSGTSMATPHVAGAAALLVERHPDWKAGQVKSALTGAAEPKKDSDVHAYGAGRVDVARAVREPVTAAVAGVSFGRQQWPHGDDRPVTRNLGYRNTGSTAVTLDLSLTATDPTGRPAPEGMFSVADAQVTVPPGGEATVATTVDTSTPGPDGLYSARLVAVAGDTRIITPLGVDKEVESYDLTLRHRGRDGAATGDYFTTLMRIDGSHESALASIIEISEEDGPVTLRLPKGRWGIRTFLVSDSEPTLLVHPGLSLDSSQTLDIDARLGQPVNVTVPNPAATAVRGSVMHNGHLTDGWDYSFGGHRENLHELHTAQLGPDQEYPGSITKVTGQWHDRASRYHLAWYVHSRMVTGFERRPAEKDLAAIRVDAASHLDGAQGRLATAVQLPDFLMRNYLAPYDTTLPGTVTHYVNVDDGVRWQALMWEEGDGASNYFEAPLRSYQPGRTYRESFNRGVFSPALPWQGYVVDGVSRTGDVMSVAVPLYSDGAGHLNDRLGQEGTTTLHRNGTLVDRVATPGQADFTVPADAGRYRLVLDAQRPAPSTLSTRVRVCWTFRSRHTGETEPTRLPVSVVRFSPDLDAHNTAPAGERYAVPVAVQPLPGSTAGAVRKLEVDVSYDDGENWKRAKVRDSAVVLHHPAGSGFVSLRATAEDSKGNTVELTVIRAYRLG